MIIRRFAEAFGLVNKFCLSGALSGQSPMKRGEIRLRYDESGYPKIARNVFRRVIKMLVRYERLKKGRVISNSGLLKIPVYSIRTLKVLNIRPAKTIPLSGVAIPATILLLAIAIYVFFH